MERLQGSPLAGDNRVRRLPRLPPRIHGSAPHSSRSVSFVRWWPGPLERRCHSVEFGHFRFSTAVAAAWPSNFRSGASLHDIQLALHFGEAGEASVLLVGLTATNSVLANSGRNDHSKWPSVRFFPFSATTPLVSWAVHCSAFFGNSLDDELLVEAEGSADDAVIFACCRISSA